MQPKIKTKGLENQTKPPTSSTPSTSLQNHPIFPIGSEVEVTSDEEGFSGAWYCATVIQPSSSEQQQQGVDGKVFVEYKNLLNEHDPSLLKEFVDVEFLRPKPPLDEDDKISFDLDDAVDAFYQDGWWSGIVTSVVSKDKYRVTFYNPPDELEFHSSDLRVHKDWVHGIWVLPQFQRMRDLNFSPGTAVEVNTDPDSSSDVWFPATFIKQAANNSYLVEFQSSKEVGLQKVAVDSLHIRPSPPCSSNKAFNLLEKVDAFYDFRWLSGVVTKILADGRYIVYFKRTKKEKELSHTDLRLHMEWNSGKWIHFSQDTSVTSNSEKRSNYVVNGGNKEKTCVPFEVSVVVKKNAALDRNSTVTLKSCQKELTPGNEKASYSSATPSSKRTKQTSANGDSYSRPSRRSNEEPASNVLLSSETCKSKTQQMENSSYGTPLNLDSPPPGHSVQFKTKQFEDSSQPSDPTEMTVDYDKHSASRKRGRPPRQRALPSEDVDGETIDQTPISSDVMKPFGTIVMGLTHDGKMVDSLGESSSQHRKAVEDEEKNADSSADHESIGSEQQKEGEVTNLKRKRGRPPKVLFRLGSPQTKEAEFAEEEKKNDASDAKGDERHSPTNEVEKPVAMVEPSGINDSTPADYDASVRKFTEQIKLLSDIRRLNTRSTSKKTGRKQRKVPTESVMVDINEPVKPIILRKGRKQKPTKLVETQIEDGVDNSRMRVIEVFNNGVARDVDRDRVIAGTSSNASDDDRPLSAWFEGIPPGGTAGQSSESGERGEEIRTAAVGQLEEKEQDKSTSTENGSREQDKNDEIPIQSQSTAIVVPVEEQDLPFVKNSLIWELIENMEVLKRIPQKPHFWPLYNCKEECREGLAIGSMVTFTSLVERISKSRFSDPITQLDGYLEALVDLEELGFSVSPVRDQLKRMMSIKFRCEKAESSSKEIETKILERRLEQSKINEEVAELDKKIAELKEKRALVVSKKEKKDAEVTLLQTNIDAVKYSIEQAEREFEKETTSLW
ncbi:hypothetical protein SOVF_060150 isoform B [Spinacia oleracea]|nr:hypothetical protein SOVF_060150 isoform B [Spinacia oleracea]